MLSSVYSNRALTHAVCPATIAFDARLFGHEAVKGLYSFTHEYSRRTVTWLGLTQSRQAEPDPYI